MQQDYALSRGCMEVEEIMNVVVKKEEEEEDEDEEHNKTKEVMNGMFNFQTMCGRSTLTG